MLAAESAESRPFGSLIWQPLFLLPCDFSDPNGLGGRLRRRLPQVTAIVGGLAKIMIQYCQCIGAIRRYFQEIARNGEATSSAARLVLLVHGAPQAGPPAGPKGDGDCLQPKATDTHTHDTIRYDIRVNVCQWLTARAPLFGT